MFLITSLIPLSGAETKSNAILECNLENPEEFDIYVDCIAWWSLRSDNQSKGVFYYNIIIGYTGEYNSSKDYTITLHAYIIGVNEVYNNNWSVTFGTNYTPKRQYSGTDLPCTGVQPIIREKPNEFKVEFETNYPGEKNTNNNKTVDVGDGITVYGDVTLDGDPIDGLVWINADSSHFLTRYIEGNVYNDRQVGRSYYEIGAPYLPGYIYPIEVTKKTGNYEHQIKNLSLIESQRIYRLDFELPPIENDPPNRPNIDGTTSGKPGEIYTYEFTITDPNEDPLLELKIDFGDGNITFIQAEGGPPDYGTWVSGKKVIVNHSWDNKGSYTLKAKVMDIYTDWSEWETYEITMPKTKNKAVNLPLGSITIWGIVMGREKSKLGGIKDTPLAGAKVTIKEQKLIGGYKDTTYSKISGLFVFRNVPRGISVRVRADHIGYNSLQTPKITTSFVSQFFPRIFILNKS